MSHYVNIPINEMREFLRPDKGWKETIQGKEIVFYLNLIKYPFIQIKVFTGIKNETGISRECGKDAIRVCSINLITKQGWIKTSRVYRVEGWKNNLKERVIKVIKCSKGRVRGEQEKQIKPINLTPTKPINFSSQSRVKKFPINNKSFDYRGESEVLELESLHS